MSNTELWEALGKTDPAHTKQFSRAGGFKGTALKPMWAIKRLTEQFGPVGVGWGTDKPSFQTVNGPEGEVLVYCTVSVWHGSRDNTAWGVGGDKAIARNKNGLFLDDEAFKKAFTDATMNGFKSLGVGADIHMGLFDDNKYVAAMEREFSPVAELPTGPINDKTRDWLQAQIDATGQPVGEFCAAHGVTSLKEITYERIDEAKAWLRDNKRKAT